jgi:hypothetical protein
MVVSRRPVHVKKSSGGTLTDELAVQCNYGGPRAAGIVIRSIDIYSFETVLDWRKT